VTRVRDDWRSDNVLQSRTPRKYSADLFEFQIPAQPLLNRAGSEVLPATQILRGLLPKSTTPGQPIFGEADFGETTVKS